MDDLPDVPFSPESYTAEFKRIRFLLRGFSRGEILTHGRGWLYSLENDGKKIATNKPWVAAQAMKWAFLDDYPYPENWRLGFDEGRKRFIDILQKIWDLTGVNRMPSDFGTSFLFMRALAFQQFPFQPFLSRHAIGRQPLLFADPKTPFYDNELSKLTGLNIQRFFEMAFFVATKVIVDKTGIFNPGQIAGKENKIDEAELVSILKACSVSLERIPARLREITAGKMAIGTPEEYFDFTPFAQFPFIEAPHGGDRNRPIYSCLNQSLYFRWMESAVYDLLKRNDHVKFGLKFGRTFERYIDGLLRDHGYEFLTEEQFISKYEHSGRVVDFILREGAFDLFIDAKAVEASHSGRTTHRTHKLVSTLKSTVIDAVIQANSTRQKLSAAEDSRRQAFAIVVTYRDHYLGSGQQFFGSIAPGEMEKMRAKFGDLTIPPENIFFLSIEDLEHLLHGLSREGRQLTDFLSKVSEVESGVARQSKFHFKLHLDEAKYFEPLPAVKHRFEEFFARIQSTYFVKIPQISA